MSKKRLTVNLPVDLLEQLRNAAYWNPGMTLAAMVERGIRSSLQDAVRIRGGPFPARLGELKGGRPRRLANGCAPHPRPRLSAARRFIPIQVRAAQCSRSLSTS